MFQVDSPAQSNFCDNLSGLLGGVVEFSPVHVSDKIKSDKKGCILLCTAYHPRNYFRWIKYMLKKASGFKTIILIVTHAHEDLFDELKQSKSISDKMKRKLKLFPCFRTPEQSQLDEIKTLITST